MSDTRRDYRFIVAEHAVDLLERIVSAKLVPVPTNWQKASLLVREAKSLVKKLRYSFMPPTLLSSSEEALRVQGIAKELASLLFPREWIDRLKSERRARKHIADAKYAIRVLYGLPYRLGLGDENDPYYAIDFECVKVLSVEKHPDAQNLYVTTAAGIYNYVIVTNIAGIRRSEYRVAAILPPREFYSVVSEAMYCSERIETCTPGKRPNRENIRLGEIVAVLRSIAEKYA